MYSWEQGECVSQLEWLQACLPCSSG